MPADCWSASRSRSRRSAASRGRKRPQSRAGGGVAHAAGEPPARQHLRHERRPGAPGDGHEVRALPPAGRRDHRACRRGRRGARPRRGPAPRAGRRGGRRCWSSTPRRPRAARWSRPRWRCSAATCRWGSSACARRRRSRPGPFHLVGPGGHEVAFQELETRDGHDLVESPVHYPLVFGRRVAAPRAARARPAAARRGRARGRGRRGARRRVRAARR